MVEYAYQADADYFRTGFKHFREQHWFSRISGPVRIIGIAVLAFCVIAAAIQRFWLPMLVMSLFLLLIVASRRLDWLYISWQLRKYPLFGQECRTRLSEEGSYGETAISSGVSTWQSFTKAVFFQDGILLLMGQRLFNWLPDDAMLEGSNPEEARRLVQSYVEKVKVV